MLPSSHDLLAVSVSSLLIRTPVIGFRAHPKSRMISSRDPYLIPSADFFQIRSHSDILGEHEFWRTLFIPLLYISNLISFFDTVRFFKNANSNLAW